MKKCKQTDAHLNSPEQVPGEYPAKKHKNLKNLKSGKLNKHTKTYEINM